MSSGLNVAEPSTGEEDSPVDDRTGQYLTFRLAGEIYGVDILRVQEIRSWDTVTKVPNTAPYVLGVLNIRGTVIPIIDLRGRFGLPPAAFTATTVVVVIRVEYPGGERVMGLLVDGVSDVYQMAQENLRPAPVVDGDVSRAFTGLATVDGIMVTLLDIDALLNSGDLAPGELLTE